LAIGKAVHYLGDLDGTACVAVPLADDAAEHEGWRYADCGRSSSSCRSRCSRSPLVPTRSSNGTVRIVSAGAAGRRRATKPASGRRSVRRAATPRIRACRRR
jgi:hypothetical protein